MQCPGIPTIPYSELHRLLRGRAEHGRLPLAGSLELTERCNNRCVHCYINRSAGDQLARDRELTYQEICTTLDQIVDEGCLWLLLTGGEVLLRSDFLDIYTYAKHKGLLLTIFTNGTLLTPEMADYLAEWPPYRLEITLYGSNQEVYEAVTGVAGSFARCMKGIELALERNLPLRLKATLCTLNQHDLVVMKQFATDVGVGFRFDPLLNARIDHVGEVDGLRLSPDEVVALDLTEPKRMAQWVELRSTFGLPVEPERLFYCKAGLNSFHIDAYGRLGICMMMRQPTYDLREGTFAAGWHKFVPELRARSRLKRVACQECRLVSVCGQCPAWSQLEHGVGHEEEPVDYLCKVTHLRDRVLPGKVAAFDDQSLY